MDTVAVRLSNNEVEQLTVDQLFEEFQQMVARPGQLQWNLANHSIHPPLLRELFAMIGRSPIQLSYALAVDLDANRLDRATPADFKVVLRAMMEDGKERLMVRFGYEIFLPHLGAAMKELDVEQLYNKRVFVNLPWASSETLAMLHDLGITCSRLEKSNRNAERRLALMEKRKDQQEQLRQAKAYRDTDDRLIEEGVTTAVADMLDDSEIIFASSYEYEGMTGDLDGLVTGRWGDMDVVVLVEAKHNMDSSYSKARAELGTSAAYWQDLTEMQLPLPEDVDIGKAKDYGAMQVEFNRDRTIMFALGGCKFSDETITKHLKDLRKPWFRVVPNAAGKFTVFAQMDA